MVNKTYSLPPFWRVYFDLSAAQYRLITKLPEFRLTKPVEVALIEDKNGKPKERYIAIHFLPTLQDDPQFIAKGSSEREALDILADSLYKHFRGLQAVKEEHLTEDMKLELKYFESLITHYRTK